MTTIDRIRELLDRAGHPMMLVANEENRHIKPPQAYRSMAGALDAFYQEQQRRDNDLIELLTAVLENVLNERDALLEDLRLTAGTSEEGCITCAHLYDAADQMPCRACGGETFCWTWRGVPDQECRA